MSNASPTPQPLRESKSSNEFPYSRAIELWDQVANVVYGSTTASLSVGIPVPGRLEISASGDLDTAGGTLSVSVDGTVVATSTAPGVGTVTVITFADVAAGAHTVDVSASGAIMMTPVIIVRRGRRP